MKAKQTGITGRPAKAQTAFDADGYALALARYQAVNRSLLAQGVKPGFVWRKGRLVLRGEFENVPRRFLDLSERSEGYGNADDRAHEFEALGIVDGDDLVRWMQTARRPMRSQYRFVFAIPGSRYKPSRKRMRRWRANRLSQAAEVGGNMCRPCGGLARDGINPRTGEPYKTCDDCNAAATRRMQLRRKKNSALVDGLASAAVA